MQEIKKTIDIALINAGGKGSRFQPFTNTIPKEMLPIEGVPAIEYAIDECVEANILKIIISVRDGNTCIEDYLRVREKYRNYVCNDIEEFWKPGIRILISAIRINGLYGNALPLLSFQALLRNKKFVVLFGDDIIFERNSIKELKQIYEASNAVSVIASKRVPSEEMHNYGNLRVGEDGRVFEFVQKPRTKMEVVSEFAVVSRLIMDDSIFNYLEVIDSEEVDLGRALNRQAHEAIVIMKELSGTWLCIDSPQKYRTAQNMIAEKKVEKGASEDRYD